MLRSFFGSSAKIRNVALALAAVLVVAGCSGSPEERAKSYYERGMKLLSEKEYVKASIEFKNALQLKKDMVAAWQGLAKVEEHNLNWKALIPILRTIADLDPKDAESRLRLVRFMLLGNSLDQALKLTNEAGEIDGKNASVFALRAAILLRLNDQAGAVREAHKALELNPSNVEATVVLAAERVANRDYQGALKILDKDSENKAENFGIQLFKIKIFEQMGDFAQVESLIQKLVRLYPEEPAFRRQLVGLYVTQKRMDDAEKQLRAIALASPNNIEAGLDVVRFVGATKGADTARQELIRLTKTPGQEFNYQIALAEFYFIQGNVADSVKLLETLVKDAANAENALTAKIKLAELHLAKNNIDAGEQLITDILSKDNRNISGLKLRAQIRLHRSQLDDAIADLRQALNDQPRSIELMSLLAAAYERNGSIDLADKEYADALRVSNLNANVGLNYVDFLRRRGNAARAEDVLAELATRNSNNTRVLAALAQVKLTRQDWTGAEEVAEAIRRVGNSQGIAEQIQGAALTGQKKLDESMRVLQGAYNTAPAAAQTTMVSLVRTMMLAKEPDKAKTFLQGVLAKDPANAEALVLLGTVQLQTNEANRAVQSFKTAIEKQPKSDVGYRALSDYYSRQKQPDEALKVVRAGLREQPRSLALRMAAASILELKGDIDAAMAEYEAILVDQPGSMIAANNLASLLTDHRTDRASLDRANTLAATLRRSPIPQFKDTIGWINYRRGEYRQAASLLEEAAAELPNRALIRYHLGMTYIATDQPEKATEQLDKAIGMATDDPALQEKIRAARKRIGS